MPPSCDGKQCCQSEVPTCLTRKTIFFIFWMLKTCVVREAATRRVTPNGAIPCLSQSRPYFTDGCQKACIFDARSYSRPFSPPSADSAGTGWNLYYGSSIACPLFSLKILFSFTRRHFITESTIDLHGSNPSHGRPPRWNWPVFENNVKNSKKFKKNGKPLRHIIKCGLPTSKTTKLAISSFSWKSVLKNDLPWTNIHGFQAKLEMIWPHPMYSFW